MTHISLPNYNQLSTALSKTKPMMNPSQAHGLIVAFICANPANESGWENLITGDKKSQTVDTLLHEVYRASAHQLKELSFEFQLILPADQAALESRAEALTLWCQGFLSGLKMCNIPLESEEKNEVSEAIKDLIEVAKMKYEDVVESKEDEEAFVELVEYIRMAIILIYEEWNSEEPKSSANIQAHPLH